MLTAVKKKIRKTDLILIDLTNYIADIFTKEREWQLTADVKQFLYNRSEVAGCDQVSQTMSFNISKMARLLYFHQVIVNNHITDKMVI